ncbi:MAG TPA: carboxypeptidase-like regulatory domain-containing protein, partial [Vicinamibacteria bacterium]
MKLVRPISFLVLALSVAAPAAAQIQTGEIFGKVVDPSGAPVPAVTVTAESPSLIRPLTATTAGNGSYRFPRLPVGTYRLR